MIRREQLQSGGVRMQDERRVYYYGKRGDLLHYRAATDEEKQEFEAWAIGQPDGAAWAASRTAFAETVDAENTLSARLDAAKTVPEIVAALVATRRRPIVKQSPLNVGVTGTHKGGGRR